MTTTFVSREQTRDGLVTLFTTYGKWQKVFGYIPNEDDIDGQEPLLVIMSAGTIQDMKAVSFNPASYIFTFTSMVLMDDTDVGGTWTSDNAEDKIDQLDTKFRQIVRDNSTGGDFADSLTFANTQSQTDTIVLYDVLYRTEMWVLTAHHYSGA